MSDRKLGVAIHGAGGVAQAHVASWLKCPQAEIVSISSRSKQSAQALADKFKLDCAVGDDFDAVLANDAVDIVNLSGPNHVHSEQGVAAAGAGKHLMVEKPMAQSVEENRALRDAVQSKGLRCGLDVYQDQPPVPEAEWKSPLADLPGATFTHHIGASTDQAQRAVSEEVVRIIRVFMETGHFSNCVNEDELAQATSPDRPVPHQRG